MLPKAKAIYQVKVILDYLPDEEFKMIPQEIINYIEDNFEYDENFTINPSIPLENQKIDDKAYELLDKIIKSIGIAKEPIQTKNYSKSDEYLENYNTDIEKENIRLKNLIEILKVENSRISKLKELLEEYKIALKQRDDEILNLKEKNKQLYDSLQKIPKILRKVFIKGTKFKLLNM